MPTTPWKIAAQSLTVLDPETKEPAFTLQFIVDHGQADVARLRMVPANDDGAALEMEFSTGGFPIGQPIKQPRWLKAFERPDPNLYLDDRAAALEYHDALPEDQQVSYRRKRDSYTLRRKEWEKVHGASEGQRVAGNSGRDDTNPNSPEAERARRPITGLDPTPGQPSDENRKGMITQPPGGMAGESASQGAAQQPLAPNAVDQQRQRQGQLVDNPGPVGQGAPAG